MDTLRRRVALAAEASAISAQKETTSQAQAAAAASEDYDQAAALANTLEQLMAREEAAQEQLREGERAYDAAEARKGVLLQQETAAWDPSPSPGHLSSRP